MVNRIGTGNTYLPPSEVTNRRPQDAGRATSFPAPDIAAPAATPASSAAPRSGQKMEVRRLDEIGWGFPEMPPADADDLEYNAYRPDGVAVMPEGTIPFHLAATGETLTDTVRQRVRQQLDQVTRQRISLYNEQKSSGKSNAEIRQALQEFDAQLPDDYKQLTGLGTKINDAVRYEQHRPEVIDSGLLAS